MANGQFFNSLNETISNLSSFATTASDSVDQVQQSVSNFKLPTVQTESTFNVGTTTWIGLGALVFVIIYFIKKR